VAAFKVTIYIPRANGFRAISIGASDHKLRPVSIDRYERILRRFVVGDLFDNLWIAHDPKGNYGGFVFSLEGRRIELDVSFRPLAEPDRLAAFRQAMEAWNYVLASENRWNVGLGDHSESVTLRYRFARKTDLLQVAERVLTVLDGPRGDMMCVHAWRSQDGPQRGRITVIRSKDLLAEIP